MDIGVIEKRGIQARVVARGLGASILPGDRRNRWLVVMAGKEIGEIRYEPRARLWLATTWKESTSGELIGCLQFIISRY